MVFLQVVPASPLVRGEGQLGLRAGTATIVADIVSPAIDAEEWEALRG
jgi:hypothetical protein